ncbi:DUF1574 family protein [Anabaena sp. FACHB-709]|uniref:DUF1574 domain-containing protein n=2 Tax=Nostocaceae TaxID=1162 RepID=A0A1Z4KND0_ANAVA|nr:MULTISPECIES: DUF1574 family protein [Nostocaceae]BAY70468.1 hypothetical protein NIES23_32720 [Trichormus variabilis NIES-23]HBW32046.1 DUF1574 domain-containing protein [Nostoc sp. UBA8866]MBD2174442.1 DUF1574 family protein [Anabaena cylindrica FACHB-318]MBD2266116.1 DUF1574 family protein [Anabaena sp. FACHB-709]MBD2275538.1 DUF1574 family protein [Nostoc sp. PCC 7120 = FACHB-418]
MKTVLLDSQQSLLQWVSQATGINTFGVKVRLRGNDLHILCEGLECPQRWRTLSDLLHALQQTDLDVLTSNEQPSIYQVFVYGRKKGEYRPQWCHKVHLNQLERHLEQVEQALLEDAAKAPGGAMILSNESLARRGDANAIARYLSETLSAMGVAVQVQVKQHQPEDGNSDVFNRLWIFCQSAYSPDPSLLAEPVAQKLRQLKLAGYRDAVIVSQVSGETNPDWLLRIDLTPPEVMLKEWARWGDVQAIARLLTAALSELLVTVQVSLQESTLHIFCEPTANSSPDSPAPDKTTCVEKISSQLEAIAPQGILAATVYGQKINDKQPEWIDWLKLPASEHPALATSAFDLAITGDEPAIIFLLERLLNPDLDRKLKTGGLRVLLLRKGDLLHIMCDAPVCPSRKQVAPKVIQFLRQLNLAGTAGVRVYGRRAGNKEPFWHYGVDLVHRQRLVPEATPEFAATSEYVNELITKEDDEPILRSEVTTEEVQNFVSEVARDWVTTTTTTLRKWFLNTQLFTESGQPTNQFTDNQGVKVALVWGTLGLLLTLQTDWILGVIVTRTMPSTTQAASISQPSPSEPISDYENNQNQRTAFFTTSSQQRGGVFNPSGFTQDDNQSRNLKAAPLREKGTATAILLAARSQMPSFNVRQLDEQLALYKQRIARNGKAPDVLIIGSSRALRGVDPMALSKALALQGYPKVDVFNFGINGATAQVVDFVVRQVLQPSELPKIIIWADGSRAFNSGREDLTFRAIANSPGYQDILQKAQTASSSDESAKTPEKPTEEVKKPPKPEMNSYQAVNLWLNQGLAAVSVTYQNREQVKTLLQNKLASLPIFSSKLPEATSPTQSTVDNAEDSNNLQAVDFDGFLALSVRFHPARYYQKHPKVTGNYDNDYKSFQVGGIQDAAFRDVLQFTQSQNISLVFVNMPLTAEYLDPVRKKYEQEFQQYMLALATNPNFIYRDLSELWTKANDYFSDPSHLNRFGAYEVSKKLANDPMISWPTK